MKVLLSVLGGLTVSTSGGVGFAFAVKYQSLNQKIDSQVSAFSISENKMTYQFNNFQKSYQSLSQNENGVYIQFQQYLIPLGFKAR